MNIFEQKGNKKEKIKELTRLNYVLDEIDLSSINNEDLVIIPYKCTMGKTTVGIGGTYYPDGTEIRMTDRPTLNSVMQMYFFHKAKAIKEAKSLFQDYEWNRIGKIRQMVIIDLIFNMGLGGVKKFPTMLAYLKAGKYLEASLELQYANPTTKILSSYYNQVGQRAVDNCLKIIEGT